MGMTSERVERANGEIWSAIRTLLEQGAAIQQDYAAGKYEGYEHYTKEREARNCNSAWMA